MIIKSANPYMLPLLFFNTYRIGADGICDDLGELLRNNYYMRTVLNELDKADKL